MHGVAWHAATLPQHPPLFRQVYEGGVRVGVHLIFAYRGIGREDVCFLKETVRLPTR